jgi:hypothetical protein
MARGDDGGRRLATRGHRTFARRLPGITAVSVVALLGMAVSMEAGDDVWPDEAVSHVLTPGSDRVAPVRVVRQEGWVESGDSILSEDGRSCRMTFEEGGPKPVVVLDFGRSSAGGIRGFQGHGEDRIAGGSAFLRLPSGRDGRDG